VIVSALFLMAQDMCVFWSRFVWRILSLILMLVE